MKRNEEKLKQWQALFEERQAKGLSVKVFCKEKNIKPAHYYYYQAVVNKPNKPSKINSLQKAHSLNIKPIQISNSAPKEGVGVRFILSNSLQCIFPRDISTDEMKKLLELVLSC